MGAVVDRGSARRIPLLAIVTAVALALALGLPATQPRAATASCPDGTTMNVVAHEDDDLIFLSPDLLHDVQGSGCVVTVFVTAGDAGQGQSYWQGREAGARAAYAQMAGVVDSWTTADAGIAGHPAPKLTLSGDPSVSLIFLRLPDGWPNGAGTAAYGNQSLEKLWSGSIGSIGAVDGSSSYTRQQLIAVLAGLMSEYQPEQIRTTDYSGPFGDGDHSDHHAAARFAEAAQQAYAEPHAITGYLGYLDSGLPQNVFGGDLTAKRTAYLTYASHDPQAGAQNWLERHYTIDQPAFAFSSSAYSIGEAGLDAHVMLRRFGDVQSSASVVLEAGGGSAAAGSDFSPAAQTVSFASGETAKVASIAVVDDSLIEGNETVPLFLASDGSGPAVFGTPSTLTILDNDSATISLSQPSLSVAEGDAPLAVIVFRSGAMASTVSARLRSTDGSAAAGPDYSGVDQTVVFGPGETMKTVPVAIADDSLMEGSETFSLALSGPSTGTSIGAPGSTAVTLVDNDVIELALSASAYSASEGGATAVVEVVRAGAGASPASVAVATADGSARAGSDYGAVSETVQFAPGEFSKTISIPILDDGDIEGPESFTVAISNPSAGSILGSPVSAAVVIADNDAAPVEEGPTGSGTSTTTPDEPAPGSQAASPASAAGKKRAAGRIVWARLTQSSFDRARASSVKLELLFSPMSRSFSYRLSQKTKAGWAKLKSRGMTGRYTGKRRMSMRTIFAGERIEPGRYRLRLGAEANARTLAFTVF